MPDVCARCGVRVRSCALCACMMGMRMEACATRLLRARGDRIARVRHACAIDGRASRARWLIVLFRYIVRCIIFVTDIVHNVPYATSPLLAVGGCPRPRSEQTGGGNGKLFSLSLGEVMGGEWNSRPTTRKGSSRNVAVT